MEGVAKHTDPLIIYQEVQGLRTREIMNGSIIPIAFFIFILITLWRGGWDKLGLLEIIAVLLFGSIVVGWILLLYKTKLITEIRGDGLYVQRKPQHSTFKKIFLGDLKKYETVHLSRSYPWEALGDTPLLGSFYWGFRGKYYTLAGREAISLILKNGDSIIIGSQRPEELVRALDKIKQILPR